MTARTQTTVSNSGVNVVKQDPVSAASAVVGEDYISLGFAWREDSPGTVVLAVEMPGIFSTYNGSAIFNIVDTDTTIKCRSGSDYTAFNGNNSAKYFSISLEDFRKIASADAVNLEAFSAAKCSFGKKREGAIVNTKFEPFLAAVDRVLSTK
jgi:hypothetical protein